jgi:hypothetical protein
LVALRVRRLLVRVEENVQSLLVFLLFSFLVFGLPVFIFLLHVSIHFWSWNLFDFGNYKAILANPSLLVGYYKSGFAPTPFTWSLVLGWIAMHAVLYMLAPGKIAKGLPDPDTGRVLEYPMNGFFSLIVSYLVVFGGYLHGVYVPADIVANYGRLAVTTMIVAFVLSIYLFVRAQFATHRHVTDSHIYDFYHGIERHPRIGFFDLKYFFEGRPGLTAWTCFSFVFLLAQYDQTGSVHPAMIINTLLIAL